MLLLVNDTPTREKRRALCACWERFAERLVDTKVSALVVLLIVAVTAPFAYPAVTFATSQSVIMALPRGAPVTDAFLEMSREFGYGLLNTYDLLVHASASESVLGERDAPPRRAAAEHVDRQLQRHLAGRRHRHSALLHTGVPQQRVAALRHARLPRGARAVRVDSQRGANGGAVHRDAQRL